MKYALLGTSTLKFSKIILGTWQAGREMWVGIDDQEIQHAIRGALEAGITTIDTAAVYGNGYSEQAIARALQGVPRESYQVASKVFADKLQYAQVIAECEKSLQNLQTDYLDLYQIHWPSGSFNSTVVPIAETMGALNKLKSDQKIRHIGVSNFSKQQIQEAMQYGEIVSNQPPYSLLWRYYDQEANPFCRANDISILAYSPLAQGLLTGKFKAGHKFSAGDHRQNNKLMQPDVFPHVQQVIDGLEKYAAKYNTTVGNVALNWLVSQPNTFAIVGVRNLSQVQDLITSGDFQLTDHELQAINQLSANVTENMQQSEVMWQW